MRKLYTVGPTWYSTSVLYFFIEHRELNHTWYMHNREPTVCTYKVFLLYYIAPVVQLVTWKPSDVWT